jgi:hypothetical protein
VWLLGTVTSAISHPDLSRANKSVEVEALFSFPAFRRQIVLIIRQYAVHIWSF